MLRYNLAMLTLLGWALAAQAGAESYFDERVKDFGTVPRGPTLVHYFRITNNTKDNVGISGVRVSCGCVTASIPVTQLKPGESTSVTAQMDTRRFLGPKAVTVYVTFSYPRFEEVSLRVQATSRDDFSMTPDTIAFGQVPHGKEAKKSVQLSLLSDPNWQVTDPTAESNYVKPTVNLVRKNGAEVTYEVTAALRPDLPAGKWFTDVWVKTSNPAMPKLRIPLTVDVLPERESAQAAFTVTPNVLQFGEVKVGGEAEQKLIVKGEKPFKILEVKGTDGVVAVSAKDEESKPMHVLTFTFKPQKPGAVSRQLKVVTDGEAEVSVPVRGSVIEQ
jgi:Protein of unknown function (DUF1573)